MVRAGTIRLAKLLTSRYYRSRRIWSWGISMRSLFGSLALAVIIAGGGLVAYKACPIVHEYIAAAHPAS